MFFNVLLLKFSKIKILIALGSENNFISLLSLHVIKYILLELFQQVSCLQKWVLITKSS